MKPLLAAVGLVATTGLAMAETRTYDVADFSGIEVSSGLNVEVEVGDAFAVEAEALRGDLDRLEVERRGNRLEISRRATLGLLAGDQDDRILVTVSLPRLETLEVRSGSTVAVDGDVVGLRSIAVRSGSDLEIAGLASEALRIDIASGSSMTLAGTCTELGIDSAGGSSTDAEALTCETARVAARSGSSVSVAVTGTITAGARSGSSIDVFGGALIDAYERSAGTVQQR